VLAVFDRHFGDAAPIRRLPNGKGQVDLAAGILRQLVGSGIAPPNIDTTDRCTYRHRDEFFSHRRDRGITGRMAALISPRA
jgi:copper oxidase (laccase) domain-containing protein